MYTTLTKFQKRAYYSGINIFSHLPAKSLTNDLERFCIALKMFLNSSSFYILEKFFNYSRQTHMFCFFVLSLGSFIHLSSHFKITVTRIRKRHSWLLLYGCLMYIDK